MFNIYKYFISLLAVVITLSSLHGQQVKAEKKDTSERIQIKGIRLDIDISPIVTNFINGGNPFNYETAIQMDISHKYYPIFEIGYAGANHTTISGMNYQGDALFYRLGLDFNLIKQKNETKRKLNHVFLVGGRLGFSQFDYDLINIQLTNDYWQTPEIKNLNDIAATKFWFEIVAGIRVEITKNIFIGWTIRNKNLLTKDKTGDFKPWHIPGFGINIEGGVWGFNYMLGYKF